jgi:TonB family protein
VRLDRLLPIGPVALPFAKFVNGMHARLHSVFADRFLESLEGLPATHPMSDPELYARLEIAIDNQGRVVKLGVVRTSGLPAFDMAALESVDRAQPFDRPPSEVLSADGNVYVHWIFYRDPVCACSTLGARPYLLR